ncbi:glutamyl-trna synthetase [Leptolyngbya sp. Heron Island J]|uniref:glutamate--tRNA ligase n=1 Tax=Leptolyngbya sp. Heron Island J TaxID=1385935 RepID=UPI0003B9D6B4|nr:glutamate--tRNA ligase [Leptolyngbya sp. Heron Island J]ESA38371.1 glutamyl-trna synthetase [Leptolyngbya sp. Heron Island J]
MSVRVRIAPSPTGNLHIGTARTAVFNWLFARSQGGTFLLRVEDTDLERSKPEYTQNIMDGLQWLGLNWDEEPVYQTQRMGLYQPKIQELLDNGLAYRAYETPEELNEMREKQKARSEAPRYNNQHRDLTPDQIAAFEAEGRQAVIRFKIDNDRDITWNDMVRGPVQWKGRDLGGDMVIARASSSTEIGQPLYNFVVVIDDADMGITHVIRGEDHVGNTPKQILLYEAMGMPVPQFAHTPLILNEKGAKLSKRDGVTSISDFQAMGFTPEALANYMTLLGWSAPDAQEIFSLDEAAQLFSFERVNKAGAKFDWDKLDWINSQYLHQKSPEKLLELIVPYLHEAGYGFDREADRDWLLKLAALNGPSLTRLKDCVELSRFFFTPTMDFADAAAEQLKKDGVATAMQSVLEALKAHEGLTEASDAKGLINQVTKALGVKKGLIMRSLRAALMGDMQGPDLVESWLILHQRGFDQGRLEAAIALATA